MRIKRDDYRAVLKAGALLVLLFAVSQQLQAQSIFTGERPSTISVYTSGGMGFAEGAQGPSLGLGVAINGKADLGFSYSRLNEDDNTTESMAVYASFLILKQAENDAVNLEFRPLLQSSKLGSLTQTAFSLEMATSADIASDDSTLDLFPQLSLAYTNTINNLPDNSSYYLPNENFFLISGGVNLATTITPDIVARAGVGFSYNVEQEITATALDVGLMIAL